MRYNNKRRSQTFVQIQNKVVQQFRAYRVKPGGRLVTIQDFRIKRQGSRQTGTFCHTAADFRGIKISKAMQADQSKLQFDQLVNQPGRIIRILL